MISIAFEVLRSVVLLSAVVMGLHGAILALTLNSMRTLTGMRKRIVDRPL